MAPDNAGDDLNAVITAARKIGSSAAQLSQRTSAQRNLQDSSSALAELGRAVEQFIQVAQQ